MTIKPEDLEGLPPELRKAFETADAETAPPPAVRAPEGSPPRPAPAGEVPSDFERAVRFAQVIGPASEGSRNQALNVLAYKLLLKFNLSVSDLREICLSWASNCSPPLPDREALATIQSAWKGAHRKGLAGSARTEPIAKGAKAKGKAKRQPKGRGRRENYLDLALAFLARRGYGEPGDDCRLRFYRDSWWEWNGRAWTEASEGNFRARLTAFLQSGDGIGAGVSNNLVGNVLCNLKGLVCCHFNETRVEPPAWIEDGKAAPRPRLVSLDNGLLDLSEFLAGKPVKLQPHSPRFFNTITLPYRFDPAATCPRFLRFLEEVQPEADTRGVLQEWNGYCLTPDTRMQRFLMLEGAGANGKSVYLAALRGLIGEGNYSAARMQDFCSERTFQIVNTFGKLANIEADLGHVKPKEEGQLKKYVDGSPFEIERKNRDPLTLTPTARLVFATNTPPHFNDRTEGTWRRLLYVPFRVTIPEERQVKGMDKPEYWADEMPGILNHALEGLRRLYTRGRFEETIAFKKAKTEYRDELNPAARFLADHYAWTDGKDEIPAQAVYNRYLDWLKEEGHTGKLHKCHFGRELKRAFPNIEQTHPKYSDLTKGRDRFWIGLKALTDAEAEAAHEQQILEQIA